MIRRHFYLLLVDFFSAGFLIRHIADVVLLFAKNTFGASEVKVQAKTVLTQHDIGECTNLAELLEYQQYAFDNLKAIIEKQTDEDWQQTVTTKEFGTKTKAEAIGRIISHTAYHAEQLSLTLKYGRLLSSLIVMINIIDILSEPG